MESDPYADLAQAFIDHYDSVRGRVRYTLAARQLDGHLPALPARVIDVGGGAGQQSIRLAAKGYEVVLVDPSKEMLDRARQALEHSKASLRSKVRLMEATGEGAVDVLQGEQFEVVLCQGVLMYLEKPDSMVAALSRLAAPGGVISIIAKNRRALAMRPALEHRWIDSIAAMDARADTGRLGVTTRGDDLDELTRLLNAQGCDLERWYGIRVFTDHLGDEPPGKDIDQVLEAEWLAGQRDPYRGVARLLHLIARRRKCTRSRRDDRMNDPVATFLTLADIPGENLYEIETFLGTQKTDSATLAVLERPDQPVALLKIDRGGEATLFSVLPSERGSRLLHETYIGKVRDATVTQVHAIENRGGAAALHPERIEITGSRLVGQINLAGYNSEEQAALMDALRLVTDPRS